MDKNKTCCFSGHRPNNLPWRNYEIGETFNACKKKLLTAIEKNINDGYCYFISGMALGIDMLCAEIIIEFKNKYPNIQLICAIPFKNQQSSWSSYNKARYSNICKRANEIFILSNEYTSSCLHERNKFMVDNSSRLIAVYSNIKGGTYNTIRYAMQKGLDVEIIDLYR